MGPTKRRIDKALREINSPAYGVVGLTPPTFPTDCCMTCTYARMSEQGIADGATVAAYHAQDRDRAFPGGRLKGDLYLMWDGNRDRVAEVLRKHGLTITVPEDHSRKFVVHPVDPGKNWRVA
jgi:hypothetical protein